MQHSRPDRCLLRQLSDEGELVRPDEIGNSSADSCQRDRSFPSFVTLVPDGESLGDGAGRGGLEELVDYRWIGQG
jgi:hypothetical protein